MNDFIIDNKKNIIKNIRRHIYDLLKKNYTKNEKENCNDNDSEKSMTINDSISVVPEGRLEKNNIVFNFAQIEMGCNHTNNSINKNINKRNTNNNKN